MLVTTGDVPSQPEKTLSPGSQSNSDSHWSYSKTRLASPSASSHAVAAIAATSTTTTAATTTNPATRSTPKISNTFTKPLDFAFLVESTYSLPSQIRRPFQRRSAMTTGRELGPLVRRWGIPVKQLPLETASPEDLKPFLTAILEEALPFIDSAAAVSLSPDARKLWISKGGRSSPDSTAKVEVLERVVPAKTLQAVAAKHGVKGKVEEETWAARLSVHEDAAIKGTASWEEFERCFRLEHAKTEMAFTPDVIGAHEAQRWDCGDIEVEAAGQSWDKFSLVVEEMRHKVGRPVLKDRTFPVLQMSCAVKSENGSSEFVVVSIPVPDFATSSKSELSKEKGAQIAFYVSIERIRKLEDGRIEWLLGTASDAAGALPLWIQDKALPGIVWKDVPMFLGWIAKEREKVVAKQETNGETTQAPVVTNGSPAELAVEETAPAADKAPENGETSPSN